MAVKKYKMFVDGKWVSSHTGETWNVINPANQEVIATVPLADEEDARMAIMAARRAFDKGPWRKMSQVERGKLLFALARAIRDQAEELAQLETLNSGKPIRESRMDMSDAADCFEFYGGLADKINGDIVPVPDPNIFAMVLREPVGVVGQIIPWNYPLLMAAWKLAPALATGNCCVLKPAEITPLTALELAKLIKEVGFPDGVVNIINGLGPVAGMELAKNEYVDKIAFTGSTEVGKQLMIAAAGNVKKISLELGGKSPMIVFEDADFPLAVEWVQFGIFVNQGEVCSATSRLYLHDKIHDRFVEELTKKAKRIKIGNPLEEATEMGPIASEKQLNKVMHYIELGKKEGAEIAYGGKRLQNGELKKGFYVSPTIFTNVKNNMKVVQDEIFGPVLTVMKFREEDEAIELANQTRYGLAAGVFTRDINRAFRITKELRAGILWVNSSQPCFNQLPWGGYKQSGIGRELGRYAVEEYTQLKQVTINLNESPLGWYT
ncbi:MAG: glycine betaine aldehyde dehydrogenase [Candidatus Dadabacteria bacterium CSP1-2]|jgi:betaine-aldehyde dehydrogenase|nr:MAG: glycine betaine aldehyde dehydrogenase [Candidatus Dadabacteria bacterium CSP1-2]